MTNQPEIKLLDGKTALRMLGNAYRLNCVEPDPKNFYTNITGQDKRIHDRKLACSFGKNFIGIRIQQVAKIARRFIEKLLRKF